MISEALRDKEEAIRVLASASLGDIKARSAIPQLQDAMDNDKSPQVSFAAAQSLWKMGDRAGRDVFYEVLDGERKVKPSLLKSKMHEARMEMHDPKALALIGVNETSCRFVREQQLRRSHFTFSQILFNTVETLGRRARFPDGGNTVDSFGCSCVHIPGFPKVSRGFC